MLQFNPRDRFLFKRVSGSVHRFRGCSGPHVKNHCHEIDWKGSRIRVLAGSGGSKRASVLEPVLRCRALASLQDEGKPT